VSFGMGSARVRRRVSRDVSFVSRVFTWDLRVAACCSASAFLLGSLRMVSPTRFLFFFVWFNSTPVRFHSEYVCAREGSVSGGMGALRFCALRDLEVMFSERER